MAETKNIRRNVEKRAAAAKRDAEEMWEEGADMAQGYINDVKERAGEAWEGTKRQVKKGAVETQKYAEDHPWHMAAIGAVAGFLLAAIVIRRRD